MGLPNYEVRITTDIRHVYVYIYMNISRIVEVRTQTYDRNVGAGAYCFVCMMSYLVIHVLHDVVPVLSTGGGGRGPLGRGGPPPLI